MTRPGDGVRAIASRVFQPETMESVIDPIVADLQCEYGDALMRSGAVACPADPGPQLRRPRRRGDQARRTVHLRSTERQSGFRSRADVDGLDRRLGHLHSRPRAAGPLELSMVGRRCLLWRGSLPHSGAAGIALEHPRRALRRGVDRGPRKGTQLPAVLDVLGIALLFTAVVWAVLEWAVPEGNQTFREMMAARLLTGAVNEAGAWPERVGTFTAGAAERSGGRLALPRALGYLLCGSTAQPFRRTALPGTSVARLRRWRWRSRYSCPTAPCVWMFAEGPRIPRCRWSPRRGCRTWCFCSSPPSCSCATGDRVAP